MSIHFFTDHTNLPSQANNDMKFGPDPNALTTKFDITSQFQFSALRKAFACQDGMLIVQKNDQSSSLVNVIIAPSNPTAVNGISVRYFIYRGITADSFFNNGNIISEDPGNNEFIASYWRYRSKATSHTTLPLPSVLDIGFGDNTLPLTDPVSLNELRPVKDLFNGKSPAKSFLVKQGMWIGNFQVGQIGFDIELESDTKFYQTLKNCRAATIDIQTGSLGGVALKAEKEKILNFIDPAAFFGAHVDVGVNTTTYTGNTKNPFILKKLSTGLYADIIDKFTNKNRVYLDIKSERGMSYNFYGNYHISSSSLANIRLNGADENAAIEYQSSGWPIYFFTNVINENANKNKISLRLRIDSNASPVIFVENKNFSKGDTNKLFNFFSKNDVIENQTASWTKNFYIYFPHVQDSAHNNLANYIKLYYYLGNPVTAGTTNLLNRKYYDSAFCSIDLEDLGDGTITNAQAESISKPYVKEARHTDGTGNFSYASETGAYWDNTRILFYSKCNIKESGSGKLYLNNQPTNLELNNTKYSQELKSKFSIVSKKYQTANGDLKILGLNSYKQINEYKEKEDLMLLGLTLTQLEQLKNTTGLSEYHPRHILLERNQANHLADTSSSHFRYYTYTVKLQGLDNSGVPHVVDPSPAITVNSRDNVFFNSTEFATEDYSAGVTQVGDNRIEFHIYASGHVYINDNIDLALVRKSIQTDEHNLGPDNTVLGDTSSVQQIYYLYYGTDTTTTPVEVCHFNIVMANQMARSKATKGGVVSAIPAGYNLTMSYTDGDCRQTFTNADGNIISTKALGVNKILYLNEKKKVFMVHFVTAAGGGNSVFTSANNTVGLVFAYSASRRRFAEPAIAAAVIGALIRDGHAFTSTGFSFGDASCYPSAEHVNGNAIDSMYFGTPAATWQDDVDFISAMDFFGVVKFRIGRLKTTLKNNLMNEPFWNKIEEDPLSLVTNHLTGQSLHDTHLHSTKVKLR